MKLIITIILNISIILASTWQEIHSSEISVPNLIVESNSLDRSIVKFKTNGFHLIPVENDDDVMNIARLEGGASILESGYPDIHKYARSIVIPDDSHMTIKVLSSSFTDYENIMIAPSKGNISRLVDPSTIDYIYGDIYNKDAFFPGDLVKLEKPYILRDVRGQSIVFYPIQYNPITKVLRVYDSIEIEVFSNGPALLNKLERNHNVLNYSKEFLNIYNSHFINYDSDNRFDYLIDHGNMLIISYGSFMSTMQPLVDWKNRKGIPTEIVNVSDIGSSSSAITNYVQNYYNEQGLTFLLLVGDIAQIPSPSVSGSASDMSYGCINGNDYYAEVIVGRFSGSTPAHIETQVQRSIDYERYPQSNAEWYDNALGVASNQGPGFGGYSDDDFNDYLWNSVLSNFTYDSYQGIYDGSGGTASQGINAINSGVSLINYTGHGSISSWGNGAPLTTSNVNSLTNNNLLPFVITVGCNVGEFNSTNECYTEAWLRATNNGEPTGAISHFGSTISQSWEPPMHGQYGMNLIITESYDDNLTRTMGGITTNGCMYMNDVQGSSGINETKYWTFFGDPSVPIRTAPPTQISVTHEDVLIIGASDFNVTTGTEGDLVAVSKGGDLLASGYTDRFGSVNLDLGEAATVPGEVDLVVTGFNYYPYENTVMILSPDGPYVLVNEAAIYSGFDNIIEYGETVELSLTLENVGNDEANNVSVVITTNDDFISITNSTVTSFNSIDPDGTILIEGLEFEVSGDVPNNYNFEIDFEMADYTGNIWNSSLTFTAFAPELNVNSVIGNIDPGQTSDVSVIISNVGGTQITYPFIVVLSDPLVSINEQNFSNAYSFEPNTQETLELNLFVDPNTPIGYLAEFEVSIIANLGDGPITATTFDIPVGQVTANFEDGFGPLEWDFSCNGIGCENWQLDNTNSSSGSTSLQSGLIDNNQSSDFTITLDVTADGQIEFDYRVSAEYSTSGNYFYDGLEFYIDNVLQGQYQTSTDGSSPWNNVSYDVSAGLRTFKWSYVKDGGGGSTDCINTDCADAAWVDDIIFPPVYMESDQLQGDVNYDGIVNILDVIGIINMILDIDPSTEIADLNNDGYINIQDVILVINMILGPRLDNASYLNIYDSGNSLSMESDGYIGVIHLKLENLDNLNYDLTSDAYFIAENINDNVIDIIVVVPENEIILRYDGKLKIVDIVAVNSFNFIEVNTILPSNILINAVYPNPFNPVTNIKYTLGVADYIDLSIYNINGQFIETLVSENREAGSYNVLWDATNKSSGIYFIKLKTNKAEFAKKIMLLK